MTDLSALAGKKVLIVEDDEFLHTLLADKMAQLRESGVQVFATMNAEEALKTAREVVPDIMLFDIAMPGRNGFEVLAELRQDDRFKKTPVMFLTNMSQDSDKKRAEELGAVRYLVKADFSLDRITEEIMTVLGIPAQ